MVDRNIADATSIIDGYLAKAYALPLQSVPPALTKVAVDLTIYFLHGATAEKDGAVARAYRDAMGWLQDVAKGLIVLEDAGTPVPPAGGGQVRVEAPERVFSRDSLEGL